MRTTAGVVTDVAYLDDDADIVIADVAAVVVLANAFVCGVAIANFLLMLLVMLLLFADVVVGDVADFC